MVSSSQPIVRKTGVSQKSGGRWFVKTIGQVLDILIIEEPSLFD